MYEIKLSTLKSKATRNFNKSATNNKQPVPGDILIPMKKHNTTYGPMVDDMGATIKCIITHCYANYIFGTIINSVPNTKNPKEICLSDAIEADSWEYDFELCTRAVIEEVSAFKLALDEIKQKHEKTKQWKKYVSVTLIKWPSSLEEYEKMVDKKALYISEWNVGPNHSIEKYARGCPSYKQGREQRTSLEQDYQKYYGLCIDKPMIFYAGQILSFNDWLSQNP